MIQYDEQLKLLNRVAEKFPAKNKMKNAGRRTSLQVNIDKDLNLI